MAEDTRRPWGSWQGSAQRSPSRRPDRLSLSLATVKIRLHRARALLYAELRRHCRCYRNEHGELMGEPSSIPAKPSGERS